MKRGAGVQFISLDEIAAEELRQQCLTNGLSPAESLDARWAGVLLQRALEKVRAEFAVEGKIKTFEALASFLAGEKSDITYEEAAQKLALGLGAVKTQIHRLRRQFAEAVRREVLQTVSAPHEVDEELRQLRAVFARIGQHDAL